MYGVQSVGRVRLDIPRGLTKPISLAKRVFRCALVETRNSHWLSLHVRIFPLVGDMTFFDAATKNGPARFLAGGVGGFGLGDSPVVAAVPVGHAHTGLEQQQPQMAG